MRRERFKCIKFVNLAGMLVLFISAWQVICVKQKVGEYRIHLEALNKQIQYEHDSVHTLKAELAYLKSPARLKILVENHLNLVQIKSEQITNNPLNSDAKNFINDPIVSSKKRVAWRYKNFNNKNITVISHKK